MPDITPDTDQKYPKALADVTSISLVPLGITLGLLGFAITLVCAPYVIRMILGASIVQMLPSMLVTIPLYVIGVPALFMIGAMIFNRVTQEQVQCRNAATLGLLISCVTMLWKMAGVN